MTTHPIDLTHAESPVAHVAESGCPVAVALWQLAEAAEEQARRLTFRAETLRALAMRKRREACVGFESGQR